jgi:hypothetical protein
MVSDGGSQPLAARRQLLVALGFAAATAAASGLGSIATDRGQEWNERLDEPWWSPPGGTIGIVWTMLYLLIAFAAGWPGGPGAAGARPCRGWSRSG